MEIIFTENSGLYLYSALLQANAAIIALIGLYTIFTIQSLQSRIETITSSLIAAGEHNKVNTFEIASGTERNKILKDWYQRDNYRSYFAWFRLFEQIKKLRIGIILPTVLLTIALISNAILLLVTSTLHINNPELEIIIAIISLVFEINILIVISIRIIKLVFEESIKKYKKI